MARETFYYNEVPRNHMNPMMRGLNIAFAILVAIVFLLSGADLVIRGVDGHLPEKIASVLTAVTCAAGAWAIISQSLRDARAHTLLVIFPIAVAVAFGLDFVVFNFIPGTAVVDRLDNLNIIDAVMFYSASYLMLWDRGTRVDIGDDNIAQTIRGSFVVWPVIFLLTGLLGVEFLVWY